MCFMCFQFLLSRVAGGLQDITMDSFQDLEQLLPLVAIMILLSFKLRNALQNCTETSTHLVDEPAKHLVVEDVGENVPDLNVVSCHRKLPKTYRKSQLAISAGIGSMQQFGDNATKSEILSKFSSLVLHLEWMFHSF